MPSALMAPRVTCVDKDEGRIAQLEERRLPIYEPGFEELVEGCVS